jgi:hypothetical protein
MAVVSYVQVWQIARTVKPSTGRRDKGGISAWLVYCCILVRAAMFTLSAQ